MRSTCFAWNTCDGTYCVREGVREDVGYNDATASKTWSYIIYIIWVIFETFLTLPKKLLNIIMLSTIKLQQQSQQSSAGHPLCGKMKHIVIQSHISRAKNKVTHGIWQVVLGVFRCCIASLKISIITHWLTSLIDYRCHQDMSRYRDERLSNRSQQS